MRPLSVTVYVQRMKGSSWAHCQLSYIQQTTDPAEANQWPGLKPELVISPDITIMITIIPRRKAYARFQVITESNALLAVVDASGGGEHEVIK